MTRVLQLPAARRALERHRSVLGRVARCFTVSVGTTVLSAAIIATLALGFGVPAGTANVVAVLVGITPSYLGNRRFAWRRPGHGSVRREVVPFWVLSLVGLVCSTVAVAHMADATRSMPTAWRAVALPAANLAVFGTLWVVQFVVLDRLIFTPRPEARGDHVARPAPDVAA